MLWRLRYKLSLRDLAEMFLERGFEFTHEAVRDWEGRFAPLITQQLRARRRGKTGHSWYLDETYIKVNGKWCYLYRAIDRDGNLVDSMLSEHRDMEAAKRFFTQAKDVVGHKPTKGPPTGMMPIHVQYAGYWVARLYTGQTNTSTTVWSKTTEGSSSDTNQ